jgi:hypothetical protein
MLLDLASLAFCGAWGWAPAIPSGTWAVPTKFSMFPLSAAGSTEYRPMCSG